MSHPVDWAGRIDTASAYPKKSYVLFRSSFAYDSAPNISHITLDGETTACGRKDWITTEGWVGAGGCPVDPNGPDCRVCARVWRKLPESER